MLLCGSKRRPGASNIFRPIDPEKLSLTERAYYLRHKHLLSDRVSEKELICLEGIPALYTYTIGPVSSSLLICSRNEQKLAKDPDAVIGTRNPIQR